MNKLPMTELDQEIIRPRGVEPVPHKYKMWEQTKHVDIVCCICDINKQLTQILSLNKERMISHGYCQGHFEEEKAKIQQFKLTRNK